MSVFTNKQNIHTYSVIWLIQTKTCPGELFLYIQIYFILINAPNATV